MKIYFQAGQKFSIYTKLQAIPALCFFALLLFSCSSASVEKNPVKDQGISQRHVSEPYTLLLRTSKKDITIAEELKLVLEATAPENTDVVFPSYKASLGDFTLKDTLILPARMTVQRFPLCLVQIPQAFSSGQGAPFLLKQIH